MQRPDGVGLGLEPIFRPGRLETGLVIAADCLPAVVGRHAAIVDLSDEVADGGAGALEARPGIHGAGTDRRGEHGVETRRLRLPGRCGSFLARHGRHHADGLGKGRKIDLASRLVAANGDDAFHAALAIDGAGNTDRLMGRPEVWIAADLGRHVTAEMAQHGQMGPGYRLVEPPPSVQLCLPLGRATTAFHHHGGLAEIERKVDELGLDVAAVEIDQCGLHLLDMLGAGMAVLGDRAGDDVDGAALRRRPGGVGGEQIGSAGVGGIQILCGRVIWP